MRIDVVPINSVRPYGKNPRKNEAAVAKVAASLAEFGWRQPIVVDSEMVIVVGHTRLLAAKRLGMGEVPVHVAEGLSEAQIRAYRLADNRVHEEAEWDDALLAEELAGLQLEGFDLSLTGFDPDEIAKALAETVEGLTDPDDTPEPPEQAVSVLGDVWVLGRHRLMCGDSTSIDALDKLMAGQLADLVFTDPPYGMSYGGGRAGKIGSTDGTVKKFGVIMGDTKTGDDLVALVRDALGCAKDSSKEGAAYYVCFPWRTYAEFEAALKEIDLAPSACIVWDKKSIGLGLAQYRPQHEFIFYVKGGAWFGDKAQSDVWSTSRGATGKYVHPTQKPVELIDKALTNSSKAGDIVLDVFGGSGSTMIACTAAGREARLMELDPRYCDVIVKRWQQFAGQEATLEGDGRTFAQVANERVVSEVA